MRIKQYKAISIAKKLNYIVIYREIFNHLYTNIDKNLPDNYLCKEKC